MYVIIPTSLVCVLFGTTIPTSPFNFYSNDLLLLIGNCSGCNSNLTFYCIILILILFVCAAFQSGGVDLTKPVVLTCGGAMVAPLVTFALSLIGSAAPVYDVRTISS